MPVVNSFRPESPWLSERAMEVRLHLTQDKLPDGVVSMTPVWLHSLRALSTDAAGKLDVLHGASEKFPKLLLTFGKTGRNL